MGLVSHYAKKGMNLPNIIQAKSMQGNSHEHIPKLSAMEHPSLHCNSRYNLTLFSKQRNIQMDLNSLSRYGACIISFL